MSKMWFDNISIGSYIVDRLVTSCISYCYILIQYYHILFLSFKSPYELLYNSTPHYDFLKNFGCLCYSFLQPYNHHKVDFQSLLCVFIGYSSHHKGCLCYHVTSSGIYITHHVVFDENNFLSSNSSFFLLDQACTTCLV